MMFTLTISTIDNSNPSRRWSDLH